MLVSISMLMVSRHSFYLMSAKDLMRLISRFFSLLLKKWEKKD